MKYLFSIFFFHFYFLFYGQITFTKIPIDLQLVARNKVTNYGNVIIEGNVDFSTNYQSLKVEVFRDNVLFDQKNLQLVYLNAKAAFVFNIPILSELANYTFKIHGFKTSLNTYVLEKTISNIVAGDSYIIQGQSNAVATKRSGSANSNISDFIRVYANGTPNADSLLVNDAWYVADGDGSSTYNGNAGQWGLKLAKLLVDNLGIPVAIFNGATGAQAIAFFKAPQDYKTSQNSNYGRLYYRLKKTGLDNSVRAFFWSQGEANSGTSYISIQNYKLAFKSIQDSYLKEYPSLEKFYIFQTKDMICSGKTYEGKMNVKEAQRQLASESETIDIISTTSLSLFSDSCHFPFVNGYEEFAKRAYKLVLNDLYAKSFSEEIRSPMIKSAEFIQPNTLVIETDAVKLKFSSADQATLLSRIKQDYELKNAQSIQITNVNLIENKIIFTLSGDPGPIANISFVGYNSNIGFTITNSSDLELICFRNFPIKNYSYSGGDNSNYPIIENTNICTSLGSVTNIPVYNPNTAANYKWLFKIPNGDWTEITNLNASSTYFNYNSPQLEIKKTATLPVSGTLYRVVASYSFLGDFTSNESLLTVDSLPVAKSISGASTICSNDSKLLTYGSGSVGTIQWQYSTTSTQENFIDIDEENGLTYTASNILQNTWYRVLNSNGECPDVFSQAIQVAVILQPVAGTISGGNVSVCRSDNSIILNLNNYVGSIRWQKSSTINGTYSNIASATLPVYNAIGLTVTTYFRAVLSNGVCVAQMTDPVAIIVNPLSVSTNISGAATICSGDSISLSYGTGSVGIIQWQSSTISSSSGFIDIVNSDGLTYSTNNLEKTTWFRVKNSSGVCSETYSTVIEVTVNPKSESGFIIGGNLNVCRSSNSTLLTLQNYNGTIQWQKSSSLLGTYTNIFAVTSNTYLVSSLSTTTYYRVVLKKGSCPSAISESVGIIVSDVAVAKTISGANPVCSGENKILTYATGSVGTIQWQSSTTSSTLGFVNVNNEKGLTFTTNNLQQSTWYRVMNSIGSCSTVYSTAVQIVVNPKPVAGFINGGGLNFCSTSTTSTLSLINYTGSIQWQRASSPTGSYSNIASATSASYTATGLTSTTYFRAVLSSGVCTPQTTEAVFINIDPIAVTRTISGASTTCSGDNKTLNYGTASVGTIQWQSSTTSSSSNFADILGANTIDYNATNLQSTTWYRVKNTSGVCPVLFSAPVQLSVNTKTIPIFNEIAPICRGTTILPILPLISINNINGTWSPPVVNNLESKTYTFTPSSNTCASTITMDITVNSTPSPIGESTQIFNFSSPALVSDLIVSGSNIKWFSSSNNAFSNSNALALSTELIAGNSYYAMQFINGCFSNSPLAVTVSNSLSLNEFKTNEFTLFPNPFNDSFIVKYSKVIKNVELFNNLGQSVFKSRYDSKEVNIIVNFLPSGIYYVKILTEDHNTQIKALKL